ncbi:MAG: glycoside-pentoside-hexuronide (GPH):cation symporter, partial [Treponema sp.]|nr:glycoside-pentoside-hexuronide (GPH):cation symporter [Treponema sp.]
ARPQQAPAVFTERLKIGEKLGFGTFSTANNVVYQFKSLYYLFFLTNVLKIDILIAGTVLAIGTVWDAVNDPLVGFWAVNHRFKGGEQVRPFALWAALPWAATVVLLFSDFGLSDFVTVAVALIIYIVFELFNTFVGIPYNSMAGLATNVDADRRSLNVFRNLGGCLGSGIGAVACLPLLRLFGALDGKGNLLEGSSARGFLSVAVIMGLVCITGCFIHYFTTRERVKPLAGEAEERLKAKDVVRMLFRSRAWVMNTFYIICYGVINLLLMSCITYYATYVFHSTAAATPIQAAYLAASIVSSFFVGIIDKKLGRKKTMILGALVFIAGTVWFIIDPFSTYAIYVDAIGVGIAVTITFVMFNTNRNNIVDLIEWKDGRRLDSMVSTADNLASKLATAGATQLIAISLSVSGFDASLVDQPESAIKAINFMLGWAPCITAVIMLIVVCFHTVEADLKKMLAEKTGGFRA